MLLNFKIIPALNLFHNIGLVCKVFYVRGAPSNRNFNFLSLCQFYLMSQIQSQFCLSNTRLFFVKVGHVHAQLSHTFGHIVLKFFQHKQLFPF